jgi:hypothetical protein
MQKMMKQMGIMGMGRNKKKKKDRGKQSRPPGFPGGGSPGNLPSNWMDMFKGGN